ncbi:MAG: right-handed parallel beta-helix repeat-containing protein [Candidatus Pacearchaeota archaeon]|nr:right-handed parallel beta-helix repeat-containing protein [Candidatus Pacearchaeota archaeon]
MKKGVVFAFVALAVAILVCLTSLNVQAVTNVSACGALSSAGEYYVLNQSLSSAATCITIGANNVTLDCGYYGVQYSITGTNVTNTYGVYLNGKTNVTIKNCLIQSFYFGIYAYGSNYAVYSNNVLYNNRLFGIEIDQRSDNNLVTNNIATYNGWDISEGCGGGFGVHSTFYTTFINNTANNNYCRGFFLSSSTGRTHTREVLINNTANNNNFGIELYRTEDAFLINNTANSNLGVGFLLGTSVKNNTLLKNTADNNSYGFRIICWYDEDYISNNGFVNNSVSDNDYGFYLSCENKQNTIFTNTTLTGNQVVSSEADSIGVYFNSVNNSVFSGNSVFTAGNGASYSVYLKNSTGNLFNDSILNASYGGVPDVYVEGSGINDFTNCSFNKSDTTFYSGATGSINVFWYADTLVNDTEGNNVSSANVSVYNVTGTLKNWSLTDANGLSPMLILKEYMQNATAQYFETNYSFNISAHSYLNNGSIINLTTNYLRGINPVYVILSFGDNPPTSTLNFPANAYNSSL